MIKPVSCIVRDSYFDSYVCEVDPYKTPQHLISFPASQLISITPHYCTLVIFIILTHRRFTHYQHLAFPLDIGVVKRFKDTQPLLRYILSRVAHFGCTAAASMSLRLPRDAPPFPQRCPSPVKKTVSPASPPWST